jgi:hypothetical protein
MLGRYRWGRHYRQFEVVEWLRPGYSGSISAMLPRPTGTLPRRGCGLRVSAGGSRGRWLRDMLRRFRVKLLGHMEEALRLTIAHRALIIEEIS